MKILFHDNCTDLLTLFATQLYLNYSKDIHFNRILNLSLDKIDKLNKPLGTMIHIGNDIYKNKVFIMGRKNEKKIVCQALTGFTRIFDLREKFMFFDLSPYRNYHLRLATLIRKINLSINLVNQFTFNGITKSFDYLCTDIENFKTKLIIQLTI